MRPLRAEDAAALWNAGAPPRYHIDATLAAQNLIDHPLFHGEASETDGTSFVAVKRSAANLYAGPDPKVAHLSLFGGPAEGPLRRAIDVLRAEGYAALVVGQDSGHFLPGAPTDVPWMGRFLRHRGFMAGGLAFDLERDLSFEEDRPLPGSTARTPGGPYEFRTLAEDDGPALDAFLAATFPGRWRYDVTRKFEIEGPATAFGLFDADGCQGFALLQESGCRLPIGGAVWRRSLGEGWGALGPIGIAEPIRQAGLGARLLHEALEELKRRGAGRTIIDWTGLVDFYGAEGFAITRAYRSYRLEL